MRPLVRWKAPFGIFVAVGNDCSSLRRHWRDCRLRARQHKTINANSLSYLVGRSSSVWSETCRQFMID
jgi:hypothetical protein